MNVEGEEVSVYVVAGSWECSETGIWDFVLAKECYGRSICMSQSMAYEELISIVSNEFELNGLNVTPKLSYWLPSQLSIFSVNCRPPIVITSNLGIRNFVNVTRTAVHVNLLLSLDNGSVEGSTISMPRLCEAAEEERNIRADTGDDVPADGGFIRMYSIDTASGGTVNGNAGGSVRRRLFDDVNEKGKGIQVDDGGGGGSGLRPYSVGAGPSWVNEEAPHVGMGRREDTPEQWPDTNCSGIIRLADAATPSLSTELGVMNEDLVGVQEDEWSNEDERVLREFEAAEKRKMGLADVVPEATRVESGDKLLHPDGVFDVQSGSSFTDGVQTVSSEENNLDEYQSWTNFYDSGDDGNCVVPIMEVGGPSCVAEPDDGDFRVPVMDEGGPSSPATHEGNFLDTSWLEEGREAPETDVGEEVLAYVTSSVNMPLSLQNFYEDCNEQGSLPTKDAEPVFDDVFDLTNTDGCAAVSVEEDSLYIGRVFKDKAEMQNCLSLYAIKRLFYFRQTRSDPERLIFVCVDPTCRWRVFGHVVSRNSKNFEVRTATLTHTCTIAARAKYSKLASAKVIGSVLERKYANGLRGPRAIDIPDIVLDELKVSVTYMKAWYARESAVRKTRGSDEGSYELLAVYMYLLKEGNPGSIYKLEYKLGEKEKKQFKYLFFSLGASIAGVKHMRKVVLVDGTAIKAKFKGVLLAASMQDANFQVFPIAFGIVDSENTAAWTWFFRHLSGILPDTKDLVIVSDRHRSIYAAVDEVYPQAFHGACAVHIERNVRHFSGKGLSNLVGKAARAFNVGDFTKWYTEIGVRSVKCQAYLDAIPLEHWTQAYCQAKRYNIMSSNVAEALNAAIAKFVELPIVSMVESIRTKLMQWFCLRRAKGKRLAALPDPITPNVNKLMLRHHKDSAGLAVKAVSPWSYQVSTSEGKSYYVDLEHKNCSCLQFQKLLIPCCHALAAARINGIYIPSLVGEIYQVTVFGASYAELIFPVPNHCDTNVPATMEETQFAPPINPAGPGRRRKRRIPSTGEHVGSKRQKGAPHKCTICHKSGHNRATCSTVVE